MYRNRNKNIQEIVITRLKLINIKLNKPIIVNKAYAYLEKYRVYSLTSYEVLYIIQEF